MTTEWGSVSSWVSSLLTGSSLVIAAFTYYRATKDRRRTLDEAERAQAARVTLWWSNPRKARVRNSNDVAVTVRAALPDDEASSDPLGLGPGETRDLMLSVDLEGRSGDLALIVIDSHGRTWIRRGDGVLERLTHAGSPPSAGTQLRWEFR
ncbi:hypothetical protein [Actinoplanes sp. NPDC089786]|uniref:hypothetical protein n=1 Tax=Actinoplanes sp. NPDC089786 TaxID=3155185 RepID=UPI003441C360